VNCGKPYEPSFRFCNYCGHALPLKQAPLPKLSQNETIPLASAVSSQTASEYVDDHAPPTDAQIADQYVDHYSRMSDEELLKLAADKGQLRESAQRALTSEISRRGLVADVPTAKPDQTAYATMWDRFRAYFCDLVAVYFVVFGLYVLSGLLSTFGKGFLSESGDQAQVLFFIVLIPYMTISLAIFHTTIGKYVVGLEVASDTPVKSYPSFWRALLRESVGRLLSSLLFGAGYWMAIRDSKKQAWSDEIADTVVLRRSVSRKSRKVLSAFVALAFCADIGLVGLGLWVQDRQKRHDEWDKEVTSLSSQVVTARQAANDISSRSRNANDLREWQADMIEMIAALDNYDRLVDQYSQAAQRGIDENIASGDERHQMQVLLEVMNLRKQESAKERQEANLVVAFDPNRSNVADLKSELDLIDRDALVLESNAAAKMAEIGLK
jgi:hypothetical protein